MKSYSILFTFMFLSILMIGCVDPDPPRIIDRTSGIFYLYGTRITVEDPCIHCPSDQDYLREIVDFSVIAKLDPDNWDRVQFYGLQGADTGDMDKRVYPDCTRSADCEIFGSISLSDGGRYEIDIENQGHRYYATGVLSSTTIHLQGQYTYEDITIDYDLSGKKVSLTLD